MFAPVLGAAVILGLRAVFDDDETLRSDNNSASLLAFSNFIL